jgi:Flp pilus assembly pilin Flp
VAEGRSRSGKHQGCSHEIFQTPRKIAMQFVNTKPSRVSQKGSLAQLASPERQQLTRSSRFRSGLLGRLQADERGLSTVEYVIILVLIATIGITVWKNFGEAVHEAVTGAETDIRDLP